MGWGRAASNEIWGRTSRLIAGSPRWTRGKRTGVAELLGVGPSSSLRLLSAGSAATAGGFSDGAIITEAGPTVRRVLAQ